MMIIYDDISIYGYSYHHICPIAALIKNFPNIHYYIFVGDIQLFTLIPIHSHNTINSELIETFPNFTLNNMIISPSHSSKNLGLVFYDKLSFMNHISITKSSNFHLFKIKKIRTLLSRNFTKTLINALVISRLTTVLPAEATAPLNRIIRSSIRTTYCIARMDHSTTTSHKSSIMWLPFSLRCKLRILFIIHKSIYSFTPSYISDPIKKRIILLPFLS